MRRATHAWAVCGLLCDNRGNRGRQKVKPGDPREGHFDASAMSTLLRRFFPFYCALAALVTFGYALYDGYQIDGDAVAYMDIGDLLRAHQGRYRQWLLAPHVPGVPSAGAHDLPGNAGYRAAGVLLRQLRDISAGDGRCRLLHRLHCAAARDIGPASWELPAGSTSCEPWGLRCW